ncbi:5416_t:CDS:2, partial [Gigaspora margarita]
ENYIFILENPESILKNKAPVSAAPNVPRITNINIHLFSSGFKCGIVDLAPEAKIKNSSRPLNAFIIYRRKKQPELMAEKKASLIMKYLPRKPQERKCRTLERNDSSMTIGNENLEISSEITKLSSLLNNPQQQLEHPDPMGSSQNYVDYHTMLNMQNTDDFTLMPLDTNYLPLPFQTLQISTSTDVENFKKLLFDMPLTNSPEQINYSDPIYYSSSNSSSQCSLFQNSKSTDSQQQF